MLRGKPYDHRTDLFSLGVLAFELLASERPFRGATLTEVKKAVCAEKPVDPRKLVPNIPKPLQVVLGRLLMKNPAERYPDAAEVVRDLDTYTRLSRSTPANSSELSTIEDAFYRQVALGLWQE